MKNIIWNIKNAYNCDMVGIMHDYLDGKSNEYRKSITTLIRENSGIVYSDYGDASQTAISIDYIQHHITGELICVIVIVEDYEHSANLDIYAKRLLKTIKNNVLMTYEASGWADITYIGGSWVEVKNFDI